MTGLILKKFLTAYGALLVGELASVALNIVLYKYYPVSAIKPLHFGEPPYFITRDDLLLSNYGFMLWNLMSGFVFMALALPVIQYFVRWKLFIGIILIFLQVFFFLFMSKSDPHIALLVEVGAAPSLLMFFASMEIDSRFFGGNRIEGLRAGG